MASDLFANNASSTLSAAVSTTPAAGTSETWTLASTAAPLPQAVSGVSKYRAVISNPTTYPNGDPNPEIVWVTATLSSTTVTVLRGQEGSTVATHAVGDLFLMDITAGHLIEALAATPDAYNLLGWTFDPALANLTGSPSSGRIYLWRFRAVVTGLCGHLGYAVNTAGATLTASANYLGIYDTGQTTAGSATRLAQSADMSTTWTSSGTYSTPLTSTASLTAGQDYFVAMLSNGTTIPAITRGGVTPALTNLGLTGLSLRCAVDNNTGVSTLPTSIVASLVVAVAASPATIHGCFLAQT